MSFDALAWASKQNTGSSGTKLVLLGLAECADRTHGLAFPSIAALAEFSCLDRKSIISNIDKLEAAGFIKDTGRKVGTTGQIKVYQLNIVTVPKTEPSQKRNSSVIPANSPKNGTRNKSEPVSVSNDTGLKPDPMKELFDVGVGLLTSSGKSEREARSLIGKWRKAASDDSVVLAALIDCRGRAISEPVEWLTKRLSGSRYKSPSGYEYRGDDRAVMREAEKRADWATYYSIKGNQAA